MGVRWLRIEFLSGAIGGGKLVDFDRQESSRDSSVGDYDFSANTSGSVPTRIDQPFWQHLGDRENR